MYVLKALTWRKMKSQTVWRKCESSSRDFAPTVCKYSEIIEICHQMAAYVHGQLQYKHFARAAFGWLFNHETQGVLCFRGTNDDIY